jgi:putative chitinase
MITKEHIKAICPNNKNPEQIAEALNHVLPEYDIASKEQVACFIAQTAHESGEYNCLKENLNYSADGLCRVWPKRFPSKDAAAPYNRNPEKIANKVYCDRMGNGSEASGDGFKFRGRGVIQLTGKDNYSKFAKSIDKSLDEAVALCETLEGAIISGCYFWQANKLDRFVQKKDFVGLTKAINGGTHGLDDRTNKYKKALAVLDFDVLEKPSKPSPEPVKVEESTEEPDYADLALKYANEVFDDISKGVDDALSSITKFFHD